MLGINPSAFPVTHFDNVVAVKGAIIKISAQLLSSMWRGVDWLFDHWSFSKMLGFLLNIERESGLINFSAFSDKTHLIS